MRTINGLAKEIAALEGKKHQASFGDIKEILGILSDLIAKDSYVVSVLVQNGDKRKIKKAKVRK